MREPINIYIPSSIYEKLNKSSQENLLSIINELDKKTISYPNSNVQFSLKLLKENELWMYRNLTIILEDYKTKLFEYQEFNELKKLKQNIDNIKEMLK